jgi:hypothetical protein
MSQLPSQFEAHVGAQCPCVQQCNYFLAMSLVTRIWAGCDLWCKANLVERLLLDLGYVFRVTGREGGIPVVTTSSGSLMQNMLDMLLEKKTAHPSAMNLE